MNGVINLLKPPGMTSHDVVAYVRRVLGHRRVGHTGTLDPLAAGVLVLTVGSATRLTEYLTDQDKCYRAEILLGVETDTLDLEGRVMAHRSAEAVSEHLMREVLSGLTGTIAMRPPAFSAVRSGGVRLYELARAQRQAVAAERMVTVHRFELLAFTPGPRARALCEVECSKGTYVRSLAAMVGERLGCGACLSFLLRTRQGNHLLADAITLQELAALAPSEQASILVPPSRALSHLPQVVVEASAAAVLRRGQTVPWSDKLKLPAACPVVVLQGEQLVCVAEAVPGPQGTMLQPRKVLS